MTTRNIRLAIWVGWKKELSGWMPEEPVWTRGNAEASTIPDYEHSLDACMELIEKAREMGWECGLRFGALDSTAALTNHDRLQTIHLDAPTPAQAICAAILALIEREE